MLISEHSLMLTPVSSCFFFNDTATTEIYTLSLHDALPILFIIILFYLSLETEINIHVVGSAEHVEILRVERLRSEEHTSELQSRQYLVCRLLLEKKKRRPAQ